MKKNNRKTKQVNIPVGYKSPKVTPGMERKLLEALKLLAELKKESINKKG